MRGRFLGEDTKISQPTGGGSSKDTVANLRRLEKEVDFLFPPGDSSGSRTSVCDMPVSVKKHPSGKQITLEYRRSEHQVLGWRAVSAAGLHDKGLRKRN